MNRVARGVAEALPGGPPCQGGWEVGYVATGEVDTFPLVQSEYVKDNYVGNHRTRGRGWRRGQYPKPGASGHGA